MADQRWLVAGLGNPGPQYAANRHNVGFMVADVLAAQAGAQFKRHRSRAHIAEGRLAGLPVTLAKPMCFMNLSGGPVAALSRLLQDPAGAGRGSPRRAGPPVRRRSGSSWAAETTATTACAR